METDLCYWSVGVGESGWMLQALVHSFHQAGMEEDFHLFTDIPLKGGILHRIQNLDMRGFLFKITLLNQVLKHLEYRYFVYLDADSLFLRKPQSLSALMRNSPLHFFLESEISCPVKKKQWWNCPLPLYIQLLRDCGVMANHIYTLNSGCFIVSKESIELVCTLALDFIDYSRSKGFQFPDEPAWAYVMHLLCEHPENHLLKNYPNLWCSDWEGVFKDQLPQERAWTFHDYMTGEAHRVNPAIIHALRSKESLIALGQELL